MGNARVIPPYPDAILLPYQARWDKDDSRLKLAEKSRQIGWTWSHAYRLTEKTAAQTARVDQWISSRDEMQAKLFIMQANKWAKLLHFAAKDVGEQVIDSEKNLSAYVLRFANDRALNSMSSNPDAQAGKVGGRTLDEFALHKDPRQLWAIAYPGITWGGSLEVFSTHRGTHNFFNQLVREIKEGGNPKGISFHSVTLEDALNQGLLFKLQQALPGDHEVQEMDEAAYFDFIKSGAADEESFLQEYMCIPADDDAAFLEYDLIAACEYPSGAQWEQLESGGLFIGVDVGRKKDLTVIWVLEKLGDVLYTRHVECLQNMRKSEQEKVLWPWFAMADRVCIDYSGLGIGWGDDAQDKFGAYRIECVTFTQSTKEKLAYPTRSAFEERAIRIPYDKHIRADLRQITKQTTAAGNVRFTAERTVDGHADRFWALALAIEAASTPVAPIEYEGAPPKSARWDTSEDDDALDLDTQEGAR